MMSFITSATSSSTSRSITPSQVIVARALVAGVAERGGARAIAAQPRDRLAEGLRIGRAVTQPFTPSTTNSFGPPASVVVIDRLARRETPRA